MWTLPTNEGWPPKIAQWQAWGVSFRPEIHGGHHIDLEFVKGVKVGCPSQQPDAHEGEDPVWEWEGDVEGIDLFHYFFNLGACKSLASKASSINGFEKESH